MISWTKRFLYITSGQSLRQRFYILSYAYLPYLIHRVIWKGYGD